jgi:SNF2 family DNA or RNA helicase
MIVYRQHQRKGIDISRERPRYAFGWKPGLGKTYLGCGIINEVGATPCVVICPKAIIDEAWMESLSKYKHIRSIKVHGGTAVARSRVIAAADWDVAVTTHDTFIKHVIDFKNAGALCVIIDESGKCRNPEAKKTKAIIPFCDFVPHVYLLTGTMAPRNFTNYWAQLRMIDKKIAPYWTWCHTYGYPIKKNIFVNGKRKSAIFDWKQTDSQKAALNEYLSKMAWFLRPEDADVELPEEQAVAVHVELSSEEAGMYTACRDDLVVISENGEAKSIKGSAALMKLRQICGGMLKGGHRFGSSKLKATSDLLEEIGSDESVVIWAEFTHDIDALYKMCLDEGDVPAIIDGRCKDAGRTAADFQAGKTNRLICHPAAAGHGLTFTKACYDIEYGGSFDSDLLEQKLRRIFRMGQKRPVTHYSLLATLPGKSGDEARTVDHSCYDVSRKKMEMSAAIEVEVERARAAGV